MNLFNRDKSPEETFVREHCPFVSTYFSFVKEKAVFCSSSEKVSARLVAAGRGATEQEAWATAAEALRRRLAQLESLRDAILEADNSYLANREFIVAILIRRFRKLGKGVNHEYDSGAEAMPILRREG